MSAAEPQRPRVLMAAPDPRDPGGITGVIASWRASGLERRVQLVELPTSAMGSPLPVKLAQAARAALRLARCLAGRERPDLVHLHTSTGASLLRKLVLSLICRLAGVPFIAHEHSGELGEWIGGSRPRRALAAALYGKAALVIVLGERWRPLMESLGAARIEVLANGISAGEREELGRARRLREELAGAGTGGGRLLFYGRWVPKKGPDRLAAALRAIERDDYELRIFGSGDRERIAAIFEGVPGRVRIGGWLAGEEKVSELGRASALIAPSRGEGLPMALVEARAAGTPTIASDVGAVGEALAGYGPAQLLAPGDEEGLRAAIERHLAGEWPGAAAPGELPERLRSEFAVERLAELYASVAGGGRR